MVLIEPPQLVGRALPLLCLVFLVLLLLVLLSLHCIVSS
jgi:hypothetical protein